MFLGWIAGGSGTTANSVAQSTNGPVTVASVASSTKASSSASGGGVQVTCNPVTNLGCSGTDECDIVAAQDTQEYAGFQCFPAGATDGAKPCDACDGKAKIYCLGTMTCGTAFGLDSKCTHYCCNDGDCGTGTCLATSSSGDLIPDQKGLGICTDTATKKLAACDAPAVSPSKGSCVTLTP